MGNDVRRQPASVHADPDRSAVGREGQRAGNAAADALDEHPRDDRPGPAGDLSLHPPSRPYRGRRTGVRAAGQGAAAGAFAIVIAWGGSASAQGFTVTVEVDENCNGTLTNTAGFFSPLACTFAQDPGPGGLAGVMTYNLQNPPGLVAGDLFLFDAD